MSEDTPPGYDSILVRTIVPLLTCDGCGKEENATPISIEMNHGRHLMECRNYTEPSGWSRVYYDAEHSVTKKYCPDCRPAVQRALDALPKIASNPEDNES